MIKLQLIPTSPLMQLDWYTQCFFPILCLQWLQFTIFIEKLQPPPPNPPPPEKTRKIRKLELTIKAHLSHALPHMHLPLITPMLQPKILAPQTYHLPHSLRNCNKYWKSPPTPKKTRPPELMPPTMLTTLLIILNWFTSPCKTSIAITKSPPTQKNKNNMIPDTDTPNAADDVDAYSYSLWN